MRRLGAVPGEATSRISSSPLFQTKNDPKTLQDTNKSDHDDDENERKRRRRRCRCCGGCSNILYKRSVMECYKLFSRRKRIVTFAIIVAITIIPVLKNRPLEKVLMAKNNEYDAKNRYILTTKYKEQQQLNKQKYGHHPRYVGYNFNKQKILILTNRKHRPKNNTQKQKLKLLNNKFNMYQQSKQDQLYNDSKYDSIDPNKERYQKLKPYAKNPECQPMYEWQSKMHPNCNDVHEIDLIYQIYYKSNGGNGRVKSGHFRHAFVIEDDYDSMIDSSVIFKTLRYEKKVTEWMLDRHRIDALAHDQLTFSSHVVNIYGYCANGALYEYGSDGTLEDEIHYMSPLLQTEKKKTRQEFADYYLDRLRKAVQVAQALSVLHNFNKHHDVDRIRHFNYHSEDIHNSTNNEKKNSLVAPTAIVHTDIMLDQFVLVDGIYKLNDFNRAHFMYLNTTTQEKAEGKDELRSCSHLYEGYNAWVFRSPEEYSYKQQNEKIDIYSMGNIFYTLLMDRYPFQSIHQKEGSIVVQKMIRDGERPKLSKRIQESKDPSVLALIHAMNMCLVYDWKKRSSALEVERYLVDALDMVLKKKGK